MEIKQCSFGKTKAGDEVALYSIINTKGSHVDVINYGAAIQTIAVKKGEETVDVALGYDTVQEYEEGKAFFGAFIGRVANRLEGACFEVDGKTYNVAVNDCGRNHLHGGIKGFDKCMYKAVVLEDGIRFERCSPDMEEGYPGNLDVAVEYRFSDDDVLSISYEAKTDKATPINLTNHSYFNLNGHDAGSIGGHILELDADFMTENTDECLPNGNIVSVKGTPFDFTAPKPIGRDIEADDEQIRCGGGYDHNIIPRGRGFRKFAEVSGDESGIVMEVWSDMPGVQFYSGNSILPHGGKGGAHYDRRTGFCLETQYFPNAAAQTHFPSIILEPGKVFISKTEYRFR